MKNWSIIDDKILYFFAFLKKYLFQIYAFLLIILISILFLSLSVLHISQITDSLDFANGRLYSNNFFVDRIFFEGKYFSNQRPFPAILFLPFSLIMKFTNFIEFWKLGTLTLLILIVYLAFVLIKIKYHSNTGKERSWFLLAFLGSSILFNIYTMPTYISHHVVTILLLLSLIEYYTKKRLLIISLIFGLIYLSRQTASLGIVYFILSEIFILFKKYNTKKDNFVIKFSFYLKNNNFKKSLFQVLSKLLAFVFIAVILNGLFDYTRFKTFDYAKIYHYYGITGVYYDNGEIKYTIPNDIFKESNSLYKFSLDNFKYITKNLYFTFIHPGYYIIDKNLYNQIYKDSSILSEKKEALKYTLDMAGMYFKFPYLTIQDADGNYMGIGILLGTPYLLYLFFCQYKNKEDIFLLITIFLILSVLMIIPAHGAYTFSARYTLDFWPFLFLLFLNQTSKKFTINFKIIIILMITFNFYLAISSYI